MRPQVWGDRGDCFFSMAGTKDTKEKTANISKEATVRSSLLLGKVFKKASPKCVMNTTIEEVKKLKGIMKT